MPILGTHTSSCAHGSPTCSPASRASSSASPMQAAQGPLRWRPGCARAPPPGLPGCGRRALLLVPRRQPRQGPPPGHQFRRLALGLIGRALTNNVRCRFCVV